MHSGQRLRIPVFTLVSLCASCVADTPTTQPATTVGVDAGRPVEDSSVPPVNIDSGSPDAGPAPRCNPTAPFAAIEPLVSLNTNNTETPPSLTEDELTVFFARVESRPGADGGLVPWYRMYKAHRDNVRDAFAPATPMSGLEVTGSQDHDLTILPLQVASPTSFTFVLSSERAGGMGNLDYYWLDATDKTFTSFAPARHAPPPLNSGGLEGGASFSRDRSRMYVGRYVYPDGGNSGNGDFFIVDLNLALDPTNLRPLPGLVNTPAHEGDPVVSLDERSIYFSRSVGPVSKMFIARRNAPTDPFPIGDPLTELNGVENTRVGWVSPDGCNLYFARGNNDPNLFVAHRGK